MNFGQAIEFMKMGAMVCREGWNGKGMFLYYVPKGMYPSRTVVAKKMFGEEVDYAPYIAMKTVQGNVTPWQPSQADVLAEDWLVIEN